MMESLLMVVVAAVAGALVMPVGKLLLNAHAFLDGLPDILKQMVIAGLAVVAAKLTFLTGFTIPTDVLSLDGDTLYKVLIAGFAFLAHHVMGQKSAA